MNSDFHILTQDERALVAKIAKRRKVPEPPVTVRVAYYVQGNFTTALMMDGFSPRLWVGVAKRLPTDAPSLTIAMNTALSRAVKAMPILLQRG